MFGESDARRDVDPDAGGPLEIAGEDATPDETDVDAAPTPPVTGDEAVDDAMVQLAEAQAGSFQERIDAGEHAHRSLQSRLGGLGGA